MSIFFMFLSLSCAVGGSEDSHGGRRDHSISVTGNMPKRFDMSYAASPGTNNVASFVVDGTTFHVVSPGIEKVLHTSSTPSACNDSVIQANGGQHNIRISFTGDSPECPHIPGTANVPLYGAPLCNNAPFVLIDALIKGFGVLIIFLGVWLLVRRIEVTNHSLIRSMSFRLRLRTSSRVSSPHQHGTRVSTGEYQDVPVIIPSEIMDESLCDARGEGLTHARTIKCESVASTDKSIPVAVNATERSTSGSSMYTDNEVPVVVVEQPAPLDSLKACTPPGSVSNGEEYVQLDQVGNDTNSARELKFLTQFNTNGMVDAITSAELGSLLSDKLGQLILGGVHPNVRSKIARAAGNASV